jgi:drug/metabolite transporter (DMT)-like permease
MITIVRFLIGFVVLFPFLLGQQRREKQALSLSDLYRISLPGIINVVGAMLFLQLAVFYGKASTSAILISSNPIFVFFLAPLILKEKLSPGRLAGMLLGLGGIIFVIRGDIPSLVSGSDPALGFIYGLLASFTFALFTVMAKKQVLRYGNVRFNTISFLVGALILLIVSLLIGLDLTFEITGPNIAYIAYLGLFVTVAAYLFYFAGLRNVPTTTGSMIFFLKPFLASFLSWLLLGEKISPLQICGIILIIGGIYLGQRCAPAVRDEVTAT